MRKQLPEPMVFADHVVLSGGNGVGMTEYIQYWRKAPEIIII